MSSQLSSTTIYVQDFVPGAPGTLHTLNLETGQATPIGRLAPEVYDLAFVGQDLYGLKKRDFAFRKTMKLIKIDPASGKFEDVGDTQFDVVGMAYNPADQKLYATAHRNSQLVELNLTTGRGTPVVNFSERERQCGELAFSPDGRAYITLIGTDLKKYLATCNLQTGQVTLIGDIGFPGLASMKFIGQVLYGVAGEYEGVGGSNGQIIRIDTTTGRGTLIATTNPLARWAGLAIYTSVESQSPTVPEPPPSDNNNPKVTNMRLLTIDPKHNCYVIPPSEMDNLQQNVASSLTLQEGIYDIQITSGHYSYNQTATAGEPFVLLWIYGIDGNTFINRNTGIEVGTTWTTLHGYKDRLQIETKGQTVVCALFFDVYNRDNGGSVNVSITSSNTSFSPQTLAVDSQYNCYGLSENALKSLQTWNANFVELEPGNYRLKIQESTASYWSNNKKFQLEPWALLWIKVGKVIPKLTGIEVSETWCSLNGLQDEFVLEVKEKTTIAGYFFDTHKEDNEGHIVLAIESISSGAIDTRTNTEREREPSPPPPPVVSAPIPFSEEINFTFSFDDSQVEQAWEKIAAKVDAAVTVTDEQDATVEARRWDQLENWLLTGYKTQAKELAMKVARQELMLDAFKQQLDRNLQLTFRRWSSHFDSRLQSFIGGQITEVTQGSIKVAMEQLKLDISNQTARLLQTEINSAKSDIGQTVAAEIAAIKTELYQAIETQICGLRTELNNRIENQSSTTKEELNQAFEARVSTAETEINKTIESEILNAKTDINQLIEAQISTARTEITEDLERRLTNINTEAIKTDLQQDIDIKVDNVRRTIVNEFETNLDTKIDSRLTDVRTSIGVLEKNIDTKLETIQVDFRGEVVSTILEQISNLIEEKTKLEIAKVDFNTYLAQIDARATKYLQQLSKLEVDLIARINEGDIHLYNWVLGQLMSIKGCLTDRQVMIDQLEAFSNQLKTRLDTAPCANPTTFEAWNPLPIEPKVLASDETRQLPSG